MDSDAVLHLHRPDVAEPVLVPIHSPHLPDHVRRHLEQVRLLRECFRQGLLGYVYFLFLKSYIMICLVNLTRINLEWKIELIIAGKLVLELVSLRLDRRELGLQLIDSGLHLYLGCRVQRRH